MILIALNWLNNIIIKDKSVKFMIKLELLRMVIDRRTYLRSFYLIIRAP